MKYAHYSEAGEILGFYDDELHDEIPQPSLQLGENQWLVCSQRPDAWVVDLSVTALVERSLSSTAVPDLIRQGVQQVQTVTLHFRAQVAGYADQYKLAGWNEKARRAERILGGSADAADIAVVRHEVARRAKGETVDVLAQKQVDKAVRLGSAVSVIDGLEDAALGLLPDAVLADTVPGLLGQLEQDLTAHLDEVWSPS